MDWGTSRNGVSVLVALDVESVLYAPAPETVTSDDVPATAKTTLSEGTDSALTVKDCEAFANPLAAI